MKQAPNKNISKPAGQSSNKGPNLKKPFKSEKSKGKFKPKDNQPGAFVRITPHQLRITHVEEKRLDRIREQSERRAEKEAKKILQRKQQKRKTKILAKKNRKGQPVMGGRMQLLLEKIEKRMA